MADDLPNNIPDYIEFLLSDDDEIFLNHILNHEEEFFWTLDILTNLASEEIDSSEDE